MLRIGVLGVGHLGRIHLKCIQGISDYNLVGFYDPDEKNATKAEQEYGVKRFNTIKDLLSEVDVVDIVAPTVNHYELALMAVEEGKHLFIEKPLTQTVEQAREIVRLTNEKGLKVQVGHVERFNPAFLALDGSFIDPMFVEGHRLATFNPRGTDVSVVLDLMIHDLDILLNLVKSKVKQISASGVAVLSDTPDIANARIEFENGCVANLTASRMSLKQMRKIRFFQKDAYISLDFLEKEAQVIRMFEKDDPAVKDATNLLEFQTPKGDRLLQINTPEIESVNAIQMELKSLATAIQKNERPPVDAEDGLKALEVAYQIIEEIERRTASRESE